MALPSSGQITLNQVNVELGLSGTAQISMNDSAVRTLFDVASGEIEMSDGYGKANEFTFTISSSTQEANLATLATSAGWNGNAPLICNINSGVYVWSDDLSDAGLLINGSYPNGLIVNNSGLVMGKGGASGVGYSAADKAGQPGGDAIEISTSSTVTINNNSGAYIGGGGGGGSPFSAGGGAGGGAGGARGEYNHAYGGQGGTIGNSGQNGNDPYGQGRPVAIGGGAGGGGGGVDNGGYVRRGAGGGRVFPGSGGGGGAGNVGNGGAGGSAGNNGSNGGYHGYYGGGGGGGGGWGANGGSGSLLPPAILAGGSGGKAIEDNGSSYTLSNSGTIYGAT